MKSCLKGLILISHVCLFFFIAAILSVLPLPRVFKARCRLGWTSRCASIALFILRVKVEIAGMAKLGAPRVIVSNHVSYVDALILFKYFPSIFVTSIEVKQSGALGPFCRASGCEFVERRSRTGVQRDVARISSWLRHGIDVCFFPEGTTSAGDVILPFKASLLECAVRSKAGVLPITLNYLYIDGRSVDQSNRDLVMWYGDMGFLSHLLGMLKLNSIQVRLGIHSPIAYDEGMTRKSLATKAQQVITQEYFAPMA